MHPDPSDQPSDHQVEAAAVAVVVIGYNDRAHVGDAVRSALAQGPAVTEVIAVDDCSTDDSAELLTRLAAGEPRVRVVRREENSGGCGSPRNTGIDAVTAPYVMFLDSDDVLPPGAVDALLAAATQAGAEVTSGLCVRRELPSGREQPWQASLYAAHAVLAHPSQRPRLVHDTLCVNKLYRTGFLRAHGIRFPEGRFLYEDFVFTARVLAAGPRIALVPDTVYVWHVRRSAEQLSLSLDRGRIANWKARVEACTLAYDILLGAGQKELARAARAKFLDHEVRMYTRELGLRDAHYQREWWAHTREYLARYDATDWELNPAAPGRLIAQVILASPEPRDLPRLRELAARPARLLPPHARTPDGVPVWSTDLPQVTLAPLQTRPTGALPLTVEAQVRPRARTSLLCLRLHELYGRVAEAGPRELELHWRSREGDRTTAHMTTTLTASDADTWSAEVPVVLAAFGEGTWDLHLTLRFADGTHRDVTAHALAGADRLRRHAVPSVRHGVLLVQPYATHSGALALRMATGLHGVVKVVRGRLRRLLH
ncbi:glycosyltransferase family 2 protein [Streptomyces pluripotens]|uniref:Glycosyltransferase family 2 protein n=1 Tax=Streptomyces pluripotens TaxID=1355015 RepID=A0A221P8F9_9ACTN|nr:MULTISPECIES: glycosyltransferase family A protein [Streptomyces]ARP70509.1 transferase [Streptomyces pluripotens]ASN28376.1 glycosyltransferase family 2 protein [Streptomyces pluripotens]MCH0560548.1 glycosyltransferase family 2 protein [Streptomyces sp. MUM 16J]